MKFSKIIITTSVLCTLLLTSCGKSNDDHIKPMLGLNWFAGYDEVKESMDNLTLIKERNNSNENVSQKMLDYSGAQLYEINCDLTLCFTDSGLVGFNYHDIDRNQNYKQWYESLETDYGLPTEQGRGMAVWYESPLGKDTAVYLFNKVTLIWQIMLSQRGNIGKCQSREHVFIIREKQCAQTKTTCFGVVILLSARC